MIEDDEALHPQPLRDDQAGDPARYRACDVVVDNTGDPADTAARVERLVAERLLPFSRNLAAERPAERRPAAAGSAAPAPEHPGERAWVSERVVARLRHALDEAGLGSVELAAVDDPAVGYTAPEFAEHVRAEFGTYRWLLDALIEHAGFEIVEREVRADIYATYTCRRP